MFCRCSELEHLQNTKHAHMQNLSLNPSNVHRTLENITMTKHNNDYLHQFILIPRIQTCVLIININGGGGGGRHSDLLTYIYVNMG